MKRREKDNERERLSRMTTPKVLVRFAWKLDEVG